MQFEDLMRFRRSIRGFKTDPVPRAVLEHVLAVASRAPSWCNVQGWHVALTGGAAHEALRAELFDAAEKVGPQGELPWLWQYDEPFQTRRRDCAKALYDCMGIAYADKPARAEAMKRNFAFFGAPHLAVISAPASLGEYGLVDLGCFLQSLLLALVDNGLAGCAQASVASYAPILRKHLPIPKENRIVCGISIGYADPEAGANRTQTTRMAVDEFTAWCGF